MQTQQRLPMVLDHRSANTDCMDGPSVQLFLAYAISRADFETKPANQSNTKYTFQISIEWVKCLLFLIFVREIKTKYTYWIYWNTALTSRTPSNIYIIKLISEYCEIVVSRSRASIVNYKDMLIKEYWVQVINQHVIISFGRWIFQFPFPLRMRFNRTINNQCLICILFSFSPQAS